MLADQLRSGAEGAPAWLASVDHAVAAGIADVGSGGVVLLAVVMAAIGLGAMAPGRIRRVAGYTGAGLAAMFWLVGQNLGELYTGQPPIPTAQSC